MATEAVRSAVQVLTRERDQLAEAVMRRHFQLDPGYEASLNEYRKLKCLQDVRYHLMHLRAAMELQSLWLFADYMAWVKTVLVRLGVSVEDIRFNLRVLGDVVSARFEPEAVQVAQAYLREAEDALLRAPVDVPEELPPPEGLGQVARRYLQALLNMDRAEALEVAEKAAGETDLLALYVDVLQPCQREVGRLWQLGQITVAQEHYCSAATEWIMTRLYPKLRVQPRTARRAMVTCVEGELHELGVRMICDALEAAGWDAHLFGANTPTNSVIDAARKLRPHVVGISATMVFHLPAVAHLIARLRDANLQPAPRVLVGGYAFAKDPDLWRKVGADGYAKDAREVVELARVMASTGPDQAVPQGPATEPGQ